MSLTWLAGAILIAGMASFAVAGTLLTRRLVGVETLRLNNEVAGFIYGVVGVIYAVLLGLSAIMVWERYEKAKATVDQEANELADLYRDAQAFPDATRQELTSRIRTYARAVVEEEWPAMAERTSSSKAWEAYNGLWRAYYSFAPENEQQRAWYRQSLGRLARLSDQRRLRLLSSRAEGVPGVMWAVLLAAGLVTVAYSFLFGSSSVVAQALMSTGVAATIALVLFSILAMHHPFSGMARIGPEAFHQVRQVIGDGMQRGSSRNEDPKLQRNKKGMGSGE